MRGNMRGNTRESLKQQEIVTHMLDPRVHKRSHDPRSTRDDTKVAGLLRGGLDVLLCKEVLNPKGSSPKRCRGLSRGVDPMWMSNALSLK